MLHVHAHIIFEFSLFGVVNEFLFIVRWLQHHRGHIDHAHDATICVAFGLLLFGMLVHEDEAVTIVDEQTVSGAVVDIDAENEFENLQVSSYMNI